MFLERDLAEFGDLWALMYCNFACEIVDSVGEEGRKTLIRAVQTYGRVRGNRLRKRHEKEGLPINLRSLFEHYDLPGYQDTIKENTFHRPGTSKLYIPMSIRKSLACS